MFLTVIAGNGFLKNKGQHKQGFVMAQQRSEHLPLSQLFSCMEQDCGGELFPSFTAAYTQTTPPTSSAAYTQTTPPRSYIYKSQTGK